MKLKTYQQQTLKDLDDYIHVLNDSESLSKAFQKYWEECHGLSLNRVDTNFLRPYTNTIAGVPRVTLKVPTAGGKTFIACNAIRRIFDGLQSEGCPKVVTWFVPSDTILKQTLEKLQNPAHPYRQTVDALFNHQVIVVDKPSALQGQGLKPEQLQSQLVILVISAQSFVETIRARKDESAEQSKPKVYRENENFLEQSKNYPHPEKLIAGTDPTALIQVIAQQNPVVIVDESHNFRTDLRDEMLGNLNPRFILELTATPRDKSNVISFVDAMQLKRENMVKLPVIVENRNSPRDVLLAAIRMRRSLERMAKENEANGGRYIRPIVLFQAQPKTDDDNVTFDKIKEQLIKAGIPETHIKIKTSNKDELKGVDLMSRDCEVRYIITVNALKEGWDCPFAYILATLANKTSKVDVEQILGRILRQPYTSQHNVKLLNLSYVFTSSKDFRETIDGIIRSLQKVGFSRKDFRDVTPAEVAAPVAPTPVESPSIFAQTDESPIPAVEADNYEQDFVIDNPEGLKNELDTPSETEDIQSLQRQAEQVSSEYDEYVEGMTENDVADPSVNLIPNSMFFPINELFRKEAAAMSLPIFFKRTSPSIFTAEPWIPLEKSMLSEGFDLSSKDADVDFTVVRPAGITIDVADSGDAVRRSDRVLSELIRKHYVGKAPSVRKEGISTQIAGMITLDDVTEPDIKKFVRRAVERLDADEVENLMDNIYESRDAVREKIKTLLTAHRRKMFFQWLDMGLIRIRPYFEFADRIYVKNEVVGIDKGLYVAEEGVNGFEHEAVAVIAEHPNVLFWHRNISRKEFGLNGWFDNHYPDFIVRTKSGNTLLVETKGDYLDNSDSAEKIELGRKWADLAGDGFKYFMVFETKEVDRAINLKTFLHYLDVL